MVRALSPESPHRGGNKAVTLNSADIEADGSYAGVAMPTYDTAHFVNGRYGGAFYGPRELGELETAGYWMLPRNLTHASAGCPSGRSGAECVTFGSIIGSFGVRSEPTTTE